MERVLSAAGYSSKAVENGHAALEEVGKHAYGAIVCDIAMPGMDGLEFYRALEHRHPALAPRVLLIEKPYRIKKLVDAVARLVKRPPIPGAMI
jgi:CheY-like chemotaxis protein